jgi:CHAT domain-containing protein
MDWLPQTVSGRPADQAMRVLARRLQEEHDDPWLSDLLAGGTEPKALQALSRAVSANRAGHRAQALGAAAESRRLFNIAGNPAGALRARLEEVYAFSRSFQPQECLQHAALLARNPQMPRYKWAWAQLHLERSMCAARVGDFERSLAFMQIALKTTSRSGYSTLHLRALGLNASLATNIGNIPASWRENWKGLALFWKETHPPMRAYQFYSELSFAAERDGQWPLGHLLAREAVSMSALAGNRLIEAMARQRLAMFASRLGHRDETLAELKRASRLLESVRKEPSIRVYRAESAITVSSAYLENNDLPSAEEMIHSVNLKETFDGSLLIQFAYYRVLGLIHHRRGRIAEAERVLRKAAKLAQQAVGSIESARERAAWKRETDTVYRTLARIALEGKDPQKAFYIWEQFRGVALEATESLKEMPEMMRAQDAHVSASVLSYAQFEDGLAVWLFDDRGLEFDWIPAGRRQLERLCANYFGLCRRRESDLGAVTRASRELYDLLIQPIAGKLQPGRLLLIEPDGPVAEVPFETLVDGSGVWLADRFEIVTSPGLWSEMKLRAIDHTIAPELHALAVSNPVLTGELVETFPPLPDAEAEAEVVADHFRSHEVLTGANATVAAVTQGLQRAEIFHFAGHSFATDSSGALLLAGDNGGQEGVLGSAQLGTTLRHCRLAVLSACSTAIGERRGPTNPDSLIQAFWRAGVSNVIAARWDIDSAHAAAFFKEFYAVLRKQEGVSLALARTAAEFRRWKATSHPYFWAAFHVFGCSDS